MNQDSNADSARQASLIAALLDPARFPHPAASITRLETHISHILLVGDYAYKIKKSLNLGFLDFTSLERRNYYCENELRLNRRLAPDLYLDCIPICGSPEDPLLQGDPAEAIEYAVKMVRFPQESLLDRQLAAGNLHAAHLDGLAQQLAEFYASSARAEIDTPFGMPERVQRMARENFEQSRPLLQDSTDRDKLDQLERWTQTTYARLKDTLASRKPDGFIRECHGDLHLGNMILWNGQIRVFDCIEFNEEFRWIDIMNDLAFAYMDLCHRHAPGLARHLLNTYLEFSGDYEGLAVFPYYLVYRAMVRAKIAAIRLQQSDVQCSQHTAISQECRDYLDLALVFTRPQTPFLLITHGVSGSGKTYHTSRLLPILNAIRIRSDVERKRLFGLGPLESSASAVNQGLYTAEASARTYNRLYELSKKILGTGFPVIVDATFLEPEQRRRFRDLARARDIPFVLLLCRADQQTLRTRVEQRQTYSKDAAEADIQVLEHQLQDYTPPGIEEHPLEADLGEKALKAILARVHAQMRG